MTTERIPEQAVERTIEGPEPSVGLVVGTYGSVPYVHLHLESWRRHYPQVPLLVHDDASPQGAQLRELCARYGAQFVSTPERLGHGAGDLSAFLAGFDWARGRGLDLLVKMSRRFVPVTDWVSGLQDLAWRTQYATYGSHCVTQGFDLRTECVAFHVCSWFGAGAVDDIRRQVLCRREDGLVEVVMHGLARAVHAGNCAQNRRRERARPKPPAYAGYGDWKFLSDSRAAKMPGALWYGNCMGDISEPVDYCRALRQYGLDYPLSALSGVNGGPGETIAELLSQARHSPPHDIGEHLGTLARLAAECRHVTEFGTRGGVSTTALLYAWPDALVTYDRTAPHGLGPLERAAEEMGVDFEFVQADVLCVEIEETDLLFIDTWHTYDQLRRELALHADKARLYLVFHDTTTHGSRGEADGSVGLWPAVVEFLCGHPEWTLAEKYEHNNGLTVLRRGCV